MTIKQRIKLNMFLAVINLIEKFKELTRLIPNFDAAFGSFSGYVSLIKDVSEQQRIDKTGVASDKKRLRATLISQIIKFSNKLTYHAKSIKSDTLLKEVKFNESKLTTISGVALRDIAQLVYDRTEANLPALEKSGVSAETQKQFAGHIAAYTQAITFPRVGIVERSHHTEKLALLYGQAADALKMLDMVVESTRDEHPDFHSEYKKARKIVDDNSGKIALRAVAIDYSSKEPIKGVFFRFRPKELKSGSLQEITKKTAERGRFNVKTMLPGSYQVQVSKPGYREKDTSLTITEGEQKELMVEMEKE